MREIKFRAWVRFMQKMARVDELFLNSGSALVNEYPYAIESDSFDLMRYTGLKDKNGVDIYEGDIVECWDSCGFEDTSAFISGVVSFNGGCFCVRHKNGHHNKLALTCSEDVEVIGNIYENPELVGAQ